jgi:ribosomal protein S16
MSEENTKTKKIVLTVSPIWERQKGETHTQYLWFTRYKDARIEHAGIAGSMMSVCRAYGKKVGYERVLRNWSGKNRWSERIDAYRDFLERAKTEQKLKDIESMNDRQATYGRLMQQVAAKIINKAQQSSEGMKLNHDQVARWLEVGAKIERTARGAPTEIRADVELPEDVRKRMESIYSDAMSEAESPEPEKFLEQEDMKMDDDDDLSGG